MPLYDCKCGVCGKEVRDHSKKMADPFPACCGTPMHNYSAPAVHTWDSDALHEHTGDEPMRFKSQRELKYYCREHGMTSHFAEGCP